MEILDSRDRAGTVCPRGREAYFKANLHCHEPGGCISAHCVYLCPPYVA